MTIPQLNRPFKSSYQEPLSLDLMLSWPSFDPSALNEAGKARFNRFCRAAQMICGGASMESAANSANLSRRNLQKILSKARTLAPDGRVWGYRAFVKGLARKPYKRHLHLTKKKGYSGVFDQLLSEFPGIKNKLVQYLSARSKSQIVVNTRSWARIHTEFLKICEDEGVSATGYPFNTITRAKTALSNWVKTSYAKSHPIDFITEFHGLDAARTAGNLTTSPHPGIPLAPYCEWQIDEYTIDCEAYYEIIGDDWQWIRVRLQRFQLIAAVTPDSKAFLAWHLVLKRQVDTSDLLELLWKALAGQPTLRHEFFTTVDNEDAGFPTQKFQQLRHVPPSRVRLDNALSHLATALQQELIDRMGCLVHFGPPADPQGRASVESGIKQIASELIQHLPGTFGASPNDPAKLKAKNYPEKLLVVLPLCEAIDKFFRNRNAEPTRSAHGMSAMQKIEHQLRSGLIKAVHIPPHLQNPHSFVLPRVKKIKQDLKSGRMPYINFMQVRYSSPELKTKFELIGKTFCMRFNPSDLRLVYLFDMKSGAEVATLRAEGDWGRTPHTLAFRKLALKMHRDKTNDGRFQDTLLSTVASTLRENALSNRHDAMRYADFIYHLSQHIEEIPFDLAVKVKEFQAANDAANLAETIPLSAFPSISKTSQLVGDGEDIRADVNDTPPSLASIIEFPALKRMCVR